jgi:hypothetical protein
LIGFIGSKKEAEEIKKEIAEYLQTELKLQLNQEKTLITHARSEKARFLGYDVHTMHQNTKYDKNGRRAVNGRIGLRVPRDKMQAKISKYTAKGKPTRKKELTTNSDYDIVSQYQSEFRGFAQYYLHAYNAHQMYAVKRVMELSLAKTLANKHKTTVSRIYKKHKVIAETKDGVYKVLQVKVERENKEPLIAQFGGIKLARSKNTVIIDTPKGFFTRRSQLIDRLSRNVCEVCGATTDIQMHHIRKLKDLHKVGSRDRPKWMKIMMAIRRKTLAVCLDCHHKIHFREYDGVRIC